MTSTNHVSIPTRPVINAAPSIFQRSLNQACPNCHCWMGHPLPPVVCPVDTAQCSLLSTCTLCPTPVTPSEYLSVSQPKCQLALINCLCKHRLSKTATTQHVCCSQVASRHVPESSPCLSHSHTRTHRCPQAPGFHLPPPTRTQPSRFHNHHSRGPALCLHVS